MFSLYFAFKKVSLFSSRVNETFRASLREKNNKNKKYFDNLADFDGEIF